MGQNRARIHGTTTSESIPENIRNDLSTCFVKLCPAVDKAALKRTHVFANILANNEKEGDDTYDNCFEVLQTAVDNKYPALEKPCEGDVYYYYATDVSVSDLHATSALLSYVFFVHDKRDETLNNLTRAVQTSASTFTDIPSNVRYASTQTIMSLLLQSDACLTPDTNDPDAFKTFKTGDYNLTGARWWDGLYFKDLVCCKLEDHGDKRLKGVANTKQDLHERLEKLAKCLGICILWIRPINTDYDYEVINKHAFTMCVMYTHVGHYTIGESKWVVLNQTSLPHNLEGMKSFDDFQKLYETVEGGEERGGGGGGTI